MSAETAHKPFSLRSDRIRWRLLVFFLLTALAVELYFIIYDVPILKRASDLVPGVGADYAPIGQLMAKQNTVRVQAPGDLVWEDVHSGQTLYRKQSILTLERSKAEIAFLDGTGLMLTENSMIELERSPADATGGGGKVMIKLLRGSIRKAKARKSLDGGPVSISQVSPEFQITVGDTTAQLSPDSELTVTVTPENQARAAQFIVEDGSISIHGAKGNITVNKGEEASIPKAGSDASITSRRLAYELITPASGESLESSSQLAQVKFAWSVSGAGIAGAPQEVQVSRDPDFKGEISRLRIAATEPPLNYIEAKLTLPTGGVPSSWYWRVQSYGPSTNISKVSRFWLQPKSRPLLRLPVPGMRVVLDTKTVDFAWNEIPDISEYELELTGAISRSVSSREAATALAGLESGLAAAVGGGSGALVHWRVRGKLRDGTQTAWSDPRDFYLLPAGSPHVAPPKGPPPPAELMDAEVDDGAASAGGGAGTKKSGK